MLSRNRRIPSTLAAELVRGKAKAFHGEFFSLRALRDVERFPESRFGVAVSKKVSPRAVERNRLRRTFYAIFSNFLPTIAPGFAGLVFPKATARDASRSALEDDTEAVLRKAGMLRHA